MSDNDIETGEATTSQICENQIFLNNQEVDIGSTNSNIPFVHRLSQVSITKSIDSQRTTLTLKHGSRELQQTLAMDLSKTVHVDIRGQRFPVFLCAGGSKPAHSNRLPFSRRHRILVGRSITTYLCANFSAQSDYQIQVEWRLTAVGSRLLIIV